MVGFSCHYVIANLPNLRFRQLGKVVILARMVKTCIKCMLVILLNGHPLKVIFTIFSLVTFLMVDSHLIWIARTLQKCYCN